MSIRVAGGIACEIWLAVVSEPPASAVRAASFDRRFGSLSGQASLPTGAAVRPSGSSGALHAGGGGGVLHYMKPSGGVSSVCRSLM